MAVLAIQIYAAKLLKERLKRPKLVFLIHLDTRSKSNSLKRLKKMKYCTHS